MNDQIGTRLAPNMVFQNLIGGHDRPASDGMELDVFSPVDGSLLARIAAGTAQDIDEAVKAARAAFDGAWGRLTATERGRLLMKLASVVEAHADELAILESRDNGKPLRQSRADAIALARYFEFYGSAADKLHGDVIPYLNTALHRRRARAARRDRAYRALELSDADPRTLRRRGARRRQRHGGQAGGGCLAHDPARLCACPRGRLPGRCAQRRDRSRPHGGRCAHRPSRHRLPLLHRQP